MERLIPLRESIEVEFKSDARKLRDEDLIDAVVALANTRGGEMYLGVEDEGTVTGLHKDHRDLTQLAAMIANRTIPPVAVRLEQIACEAPVLVIHVPQMRSIVASSSGKILRRRMKADGTPETVPMYPFEINSRLSELSLLDFSAQPVPEAKYRDLDPLERERLRQIILAYHGEKSLLELSDEELDKALQLVVAVNGELTPTYTGMLLLGRREKLRTCMPTAESAFQMLNGTEVSANESFHLPLLAAIEKIIDFADARNPQQEMEAGMFRISIPEFNQRAVREAIVNAYAHRDYTRLGRVLVRIDADGLTVSNPGGFVEGVSIRNILNAEPHGRNPALADALKRIGLAERTGRGVDRIFEGSLRYGRDIPDYSETTATTVKLFIPRGMPDENIVLMIAEHQRRTGEVMPLNSLFVLNALKQGRRMTMTEIGQALTLPETRMRATLERLTEAGLIEALGSGRGRAYVLDARMYQHPAEYVRQTDVDQLRHRELVLKLAETKKAIKRKDVVNLLHVNPPQAYRLLQRLTREGILEQCGNTSAAYYRKRK